MAKTFRQTDESKVPGKVFFRSLEGLSITPSIQTWVDRSRTRLNHASEKFYGPEFEPVDTRNGFALQIVVPGSDIQKKRQIQILRCNSLVKRVKSVALRIIVG